MNTKNALSRVERAKMKRIGKAGVCPFCPKYFKKYHGSPIIKESKNWRLVKNDFPYAGSKTHLLLVHKKHIENVKNISPAGAKELVRLISLAEKKFRIDNGIFLIRFGDPKYTGATIKHIHGHLIASKKDKASKLKLRKQASF